MRKPGGTGYTVELQAANVDFADGRNTAATMLTHLSLLAGSATRETAPGLHRGQKVCPTGALF